MAAAGAAVAAAALPAKAQGSGALQIWFVRHAESEINVPGNPRPVPDGGVTYPLTRKGVEQAKALAEATAAAPIVAIYTSTYLRAVQTADAVAFRHELTLTLAPEAVEIDLGIKPGSRRIRALYTSSWRANGPSTKTSKRAMARARASPTSSGASCRSCARS